MKNRHLISLKDFSKAELLELVAEAVQLKKERSGGKVNKSLEGKTLIMLFQKGSTRTRLSFEAAMTELGGHAIFVDAKNTQFSLADFGDEIRATMRFGQALMFRAKKSEDVMKAASYDQVPVIDACSEKYHPAQALSDLLTMAEHSGGIEKIKKVVWLGIENNVSNTLKLVCSKLGIEVVLVSPEADPESVDLELNKICEESKKVRYDLNIETALRGADYVHTDTWMNMEFFENGKIRPEYEEEFGRRREKFAKYQLTAELIDKYAPDAKIMHCMPCHVGYEISREAIDHKNSIIFDQAENRMHMQKAILVKILGE